MINALFTRRKRQLQALSLKLSQLSQNMDSAEELKQKIADKIRQLLRELRFVLSRHDARKILGAAALFLGISFAPAASAQSFGPKQSNPFGIQPNNNYFNFPSFADLDNDGDQDLLTFDDYGVAHFYENTGTAAMPQFAAPDSNALGILATGYYTFHALADLDGDGDIDILAGTYYYGGYYNYGYEMIYYQNTGTPANPQFGTPMKSPFGLVISGDGAFPTFADLDGDGDMDLMLGEYYGNIQYYQNTGSATSPQFATAVQNPFGFTATSIVALPAFADIDEDGDLDMMVGQSTYYGGGSLLYYENTGTVNAPQFASAAAPGNLVPPSFIATPVFVDIDDDADMDLFSMEMYGTLVYYENTSSIGLAEKSNAFAFSVLPNPALDQIRIDSRAQVEVLELLDLSGRLIMSESGQSMEVSSLSAGVYLLKAIDRDGKTAVQRFEKL